MAIDYLFIGIFLVAVFFLILFLIERNRKDKKKLEKQINQSELKPEKHNDKQLYT